MTSRRFLLLAALAASVSITACGGATEQEQNQALKRHIDEPLDKARTAAAQAEAAGQNARKQMEDTEEQN